jgi:hypothetical protein
MQIGWLFMATIGCTVAGAPTTGGTDVPRGECGRGVAVVSSDYQSSNVSLVGWDGTVLSDSVISSGSSGTALSAALGGDVVLPTEEQSGELVVLLDRYPGSVVTWLDVRTGEPADQLSVRTGFAANPHDYVVLPGDRAYVSRYDPNLLSGREPHDGGSDLLVIDTARRAVSGSIGLEAAFAGEDPRFFARPDRMVRVGDLVYVVLAGNSQDYQDGVSSRLGVIDTRSDRMVDHVVLDGMYFCSSIALSPEASEIAIACPGRYDDTGTSAMDESGVVVLDLADLHRQKRFQAAGLGAGPVGAGLSFVREGALLVATLGVEASQGRPMVPDTLVLLEVASGAAETLFVASAPFVLGSVECSACSGTCYLADADGAGGRLQRFEFVEGRADRREVVVSASIGLPPRWIGRF